MAVPGPKASNGPLAPPATAPPQALTAEVAVEAVKSMISFLQRFPEIL